MTFFNTWVCLKAKYTVYLFYCHENVSQQFTKLTYWSSHIKVYIGVAFSCHNLAHWNLSYTKRWHEEDRSFCSNVQIRLYWAYVISASIQYIYTASLSPFRTGSGSGKSIDVQLCVALLLYLLILILVLLSRLYCIPFEFSLKSPTRHRKLLLFLFPSSL